MAIYQKKNKKDCIKCNQNKVVKSIVKSIINGLLLVLIPHLLFAGQSFISASYSLGNNESESQNYSLGTEVFDDGQISFDFQLDSYESEGEESKSKTYNLNFYYSINKYFSLGLGGGILDQSEYIDSANGEASFQINFNPLWKSYYKTALYFKYSTQTDHYIQEFPLRTVDQQIKQQGITVGIEKELFSWLSFGASYTNYSYNRSPSDYTNAFPVLISFLEDFESLLYNYNKDILSIYSQVLFENTDIHLSYTGVENYILEETDKTYSLFFTYYFRKFDFGLGYDHVFSTDLNYGLYSSRASFYF